MGIMVTNEERIRNMETNAVRAASEKERQAAKLDYIAMMADVDLSGIIPEDEEDGEYDEQ